jgi:hypothetical protein
LSPGRKVRKSAAKSKTCPRIQFPGSSFGGGEASTDCWVENPFTWCEDRCRQTIWLLQVVRNLVASLVHNAIVVCKFFKEIQRKDLGIMSSTNDSLVVKQPETKKRIRFPATPTAHEVTTERSQDRQATNDTQATYHTHRLTFTVVRLFDLRTLLWPATTLVLNPKTSTHDLKK